MMICLKICIKKSGGKGQINFLNDKMLFVFSRGRVAQRAWRPAAVRLGRGYTSSCLFSQALPVQSKLKKAGKACTHRISLGTA
jgi:hypothetical protein